MLIEKENALSLDEATSSLGNELVKVLIKSVVHDSLKHAELIRALIIHLKGLSKPLTDEEYLSLEKVIDKHIKVEAEMVEVIKELLGDIEDKRISYVLRYILDDEVRHHALLKGMHKVVSKREVVTEFDWMDVAWKDVPFFY
ncbi:MAG: ferritin-like domain-containing protein [archaeon GB-1867-005]|nr:ferritin-like domain-containing protein [Candidatus Culexmicrobium cathedralense]